MDTISNYSNLVGTTYIRINDRWTQMSKQHWYDDPANFPVRLKRDTEQYVTYRWVYNKDTFVKLHRQGFKLVTEDTCTLDKDF